MRRSTYAIHMLFADSPHMWQPFTLTQQSWTDSTVPEKKGSQHNHQHVSWSIRRSATPFLFKHNHWSSNESHASIDDMLHRFTEPISLACDQYIQYLLTGSTHRSLTDINESYNFRGASLPQHTPRHSQQLATAYSPTFSTDGPPLFT
jgi:hypothetical protein